MIPKVIHYIWFGGKPIPKRLKKYIRSWKKFCPDYEIKLWTEENYDINKNSFMIEAARQKKWAFVSDYARLDIIEQYGGIYLDTDVELVKSLDSLLQHKGFAGFECSGYVAFGLGFGAEMHNPIVHEIKEFYTDKVFDEKFMQENTCPIVQTRVLQQHGLAKNNSKQDIEGFAVYPSEYFCPMNYNQIYDNFTKNTISVHHFDASWFSKKERRAFIWGNQKAKAVHSVKKILHINSLHRDGGGYRCKVVYTELPINEPRLRAARYDSLLAGSSKLSCYLPPCCGEVRCSYKVLQSGLIPLFRPKGRGIKPSARIKQMMNQEALYAA